MPESEPTHLKTFNCSHAIARIEIDQFEVTASSPQEALQLALEHIKRGHDAYYKAQHLDPSLCNDLYIDGLGSTDLNTLEENQSNDDQSNSNHAP